VKALSFVAASLFLLAVVAQVLSQSDAPQPAGNSVSNPQESATSRRVRDEMATSRKAPLPVSPSVAEDTRVVRVEATLDAPWTELRVGQEVHLYQQANFTYFETERWIADTRVDTCRIHKIHDLRGNQLDASLVVNKQLAELLAHLARDSKPKLFLRPVESSPARRKRTEAEDRQIRVFALEYLKADSAERLITQLSLPDLVSLVVDLRTNSLIAHGTEQSLAEIEALLARLDTNDDERPSVLNRYADPNPKLDLHGFPPVTSRPVETERAGGSRQGIVTLQQRFNELEAKAMQIALRLRAMKSGPDRLQKAKDELSEELRDTVRQSFEVRQQLQRAELDAFEHRMQQIERSIALRDRIADKIIDRRVEDLLNPNRRWETQGIQETKPSTTRPYSSVGSAPPIRRYPELEGAWKMLSTEIANAPRGAKFPELPPSQSLVIISGNTWMQLGADNKFEQVDFRYDDTSQPARLELSATRNGKRITSRYIIEVRGNTMRLGARVDGSDTVPESFKARMTLVMTLERVTLSGEVMEAADPS
jgi:uncharacterized protein (TIGR03067 family)